MGRRLGHRAADRAEVGEQAASALDEASIDHHRVDDARVRLQHDVRSGVLQLQSLCRQTGLVGGVDVAATAIIGCYYLVGVLERERG